MVMHTYSTYFHAKKMLIKDESNTSPPPGIHIKPEISKGFTLHLMDYYYIPQCVHYIKLYLCYSVCAGINT